MTLSGSFPSRTTIVGDATASTDRTFPRFTFARVTRAFGSAEHVVARIVVRAARECRARATAKNERRAREDSSASQNSSQRVRPRAVAVDSVASQIPSIVVMG